MFLRSGKRKKKTTPKKNRKTKKDRTLHFNPSRNLNLSELNSSDSLCSFSMEDQEEHMCFGFTDNLPVSSSATTNNLNYDLSAIWSNANSNNLTLENHLRNIIGVPVTDRHSLPNLAGLPSTSTASTMASQVVVTSTAPLPRSNESTVTTTSSSTRLPCFPPLPAQIPSSTDVLLSTLINKLDAGFCALNTTFNTRLNNFNSRNAVQLQNLSQPPSRSQISPPQTQPTPQSLQQNHPNIAPSDQPLPSQSNSSNNNLARLESIVNNLASQVKDLSIKFGNLSTSCPPSEAPIYNNNNENNRSSYPQDSQNSPSRPYVSSYKTWPDKWKVKYDGNNHNLAIEFFFDQLTCLKDLNDVMWEHVISAFPLFLEGEALKWFFRYRKREHVIMWPKLKQDMILQFRGTESEDAILIKISNRKQGERETFDHFYRAILDLCDRLTSEKISDERLMGYLTMNAKFEIRKTLLSVGRTSLSNFINICQATDQLNYSHLYRDSTSTTRRVSEISSTQEYPAESQYNVEAFSNRRPTNPQSTANMKCWNCDNIGHSWQMCDESRLLFCYWCGYKNVTCKNCPRCAQNFRPANHNDPPPISTPPTQERS